MVVEVGIGVGLGVAIQPVTVCVGRDGLVDGLCAVSGVLVGVPAGQVFDVAEGCGELLLGLGHVQGLGLLACGLQGGDPKSVSLEDVMTEFDLKQTTAYDRLKTAQDLYAAGQDLKSKSA